MSAARIREAAKVLRDAAENATPGPWTWVDRYAAEMCGADGAHVLYANSYEDQEDVQASESDAAYIALMSPPVALVLADWLDAEAEAAADRDAHWARQIRDCPDCFSPGDGEGQVELWHKPALALADTILGDRA